MIYNELMTKLYDNLKTAHEEGELSYFEIIGLLDKLKEHFVDNTTINITDIMIKRQIRKSTNKKYCKKCEQRIRTVKDGDTVTLCRKCIKL